MEKDDLELVPAREDRPALDFLVGDHPALDFLNTTAKLNGRHVDWLETGEDLLAWMRSMAAIDKATVLRLSGSAHSARLEAALTEIIEFREWFRDLLIDIKVRGEVRLSLDQRQLINDKLSRSSTILKVDEINNSSVLSSERILDKADSLISIFAGWIAELLCENDLSLVRNCESQECVLWFYDRTRGRRRRWCSPTTCGNREKVAAYRARKKK